MIRQRDAHAWAECWIEGVGWITIDGTPGDGRPDALAGEIPSWMRAREWIQDHWSSLLAWLGGRNGIKAALALGAGAFVVLAWQWGRGWRRARGEARRSFAYATPDEALIALNGRFERLCRLRGLVCPPNQTWQEYLAGAPAAAAAAASAFDVQAASAFVRAYNAARFGPPPDRASLDALESSLVRIEQARVTPGGT